MNQSVTKNNFNILIATDSFKESMTSSQACNAITDGLRQVAIDHNLNLHIDACPIADGGEGTTHAITNALNGEIQTTEVLGPIGKPVQAQWGLADNNQLGIMEMATCAGLMLVPHEKRNPELTTTFGVGQLILKMLDQNVKQILIGIGGSATNDGGTGMAQALGLTFDGIQIPARGCDLSNIKSITTHNLDPRLNNVEILVACDVKNPLTGPRGAAEIYARQKGADDAMVKRLDLGLKHLENITRNWQAQTTNQTDCDGNFEGAGAAGGLGFGLKIFTNAKLKSGIELVLNAVKFNQRLNNIDLVITGEGQLDGQSLEGKACMGVVSRAKQQNINTIALVGSKGDNIDKATAAGLTAAHSIMELGVSKQHAIQNAQQLLTQLTQQTIPQYL